MRVVIDTNVLLVSLLKSSRYRPIFEKLISNQFELVITNDILLEYLEIVEIKTNSLIAKNLSELLISLDNVKKIDTYFRWQLITQDPDDNKFVDCAIAGNVKYVVSNDKHFKYLKEVKFPTVEVISADQFLEELNKLS